MAVVVHSQGARRLVTYLMVMGPGLIVMVALVFYHVLDLAGVIGLHLH